MEIVLGPPGTGKTTTLLGVVETELAGGVAPDRIGYVSFTRRAAEEARDRAMKRFNLSRNQLPYFSTLHALCYHALGMKQGDVLEGRRLKEFADYAGVRVTGRWSEDGTFSGFEMGDRILFMENLARVRRVDLRVLYNEDSDGLPWATVGRVARCLVEFKQVHGLLDFTDMLSQFVTQDTPPLLDVLVVDEAQDLSELQWLVVMLLARACRRVVVAGDDDQAIYRWAGASVDHLIDLQGHVRVLGQSYRVPRAVQDVAHGLISRIGRRRPKEWQARAAEGVVGQAFEFEDVDCGEGEVLILARNNYILSDRVVPTLRQQGIWYELYGRTPVPQGVMEAITYWEQLRSGQPITLGAVRQVYQYLTSGVGVARGHKTLPQLGPDPDVPVTLEDLQTNGGLLTTDIWHEAMDRVPEKQYILAARRRGEKLRQRPRVRLATVHGSKGGEADHVVLFREMARRTFREMEEQPDDEVRVWYVGVTRARERLTIVNSDSAQSCPWV